MAGFTVDPERLLWVPGAKTIFIPAEKKVEVYDLDDMNALLKLNQITFQTCYTNTEDVIRESVRTGINPFALYRDNYDWSRHEL
jgi:hypothetical protein